MEQKLVNWNSNQVNLPRDKEEKFEHRLEDIEDQVGLLNTCFSGGPEDESQNERKCFVKRKQSRVVQNIYNKSFLSFLGNHLKPPSKRKKRKNTPNILK